MRYRLQVKSRLRRWLGIERHEDRLDDLNQLYSDLVSIGVDVHFKEPHMILIYSRLKGGQLRHIDANFESLAELNDFVKWLKEKYKTEKTTWDVPYASTGMFPWE